MTLASYVDNIDTMNSCGCRVQEEDIVMDDNELEDDISLNSRKSAYNGRQGKGSDEDVSGDNSSQPDCFW